ncbi:MAG TPA: hypothetical protein VF791_15710 [Pyrinomonadaceae bacterium]
MENKIQTTALGSFPRPKLRRSLNVLILTGLFALTSLMAASSYSAKTGSSAAAPQAQMTGVWTAEFSKDKADKIHLKLVRRTEKDHTSTSGNDIQLAELQGLTREQAFSQKADVKFRLVREAGTFDFEGTFNGGRGSGIWTLTPSQSFIGEMRARGYDNLSEERLYALAMIDVRTKTIDDLKTAGFERLSLEDVIKATIFKITPQYISEMKSLGFEDLELEELVKGRIFQIDAAFAKEVREMGFGRETLESLVKMRIFKVTPEFLREMRTAGLENLSIEDLVKLRIFKIDTDFIQRARASGHTDLDVEELVRLRIHDKVK